MNERIADFERLWIATVLALPPPPPLVRETNTRWVLSEEERERWDAETTEGRNAIEQNYRSENDLDLFGLEQHAVPYYECDDDDDMRWLE